MIGELFPNVLETKNTMFRIFFVRFFLSKSFPKIGRTETIRLVQKIVEIGAMLVIFRPFEIFQKKITSLDCESQT